MKDEIIANETPKKLISDICQKVGIKREEYEPYGNYIAKVNIPKNYDLKDKKLILVTAMSSTPAGEGKTTLAIGLADALNSLGKKAVGAIREPSVGPVMGLKGGATGGGYSQVVPHNEINLHFTGDFHAIQIANNTLAALIDNNIYQGNPLNIDPKRLLFSRAIDVNDRSLREIVLGLGKRTNGVMREDKFEITAASEIMAILCLSKDYKDLKQRIGRILIGYSYDNEPVFVDQLKIEGAISALLVNALKPNLVQSLFYTPIFIHGGPFANIAHGTNSIIATKTALNYGEYVVTECGFGADLGAEKYLDLVSPVLGKHPYVIVLTSSIRSLKYQVQGSMKDLNKENIIDVENGFNNLKQHLNNLKKTGIKVVVAINRFTTDTDNELNTLTNLLDRNSTKWAICNTYEEGAKGGEELAKIIVSETNNEVLSFKPFYNDTDDLLEKIQKLAKNVYHADEVEYSTEALRNIKEIRKHNWDKLPICVAKTPQSFSDDPKKLGAPRNFKLHIKEVRVKLGAGFLVIYTGNILTMPGLSANPAALSIDIDDEGNITGIN